MLQSVVHEEFGLLVQEAYHETNRWLVSKRHVLPEVDLRPFIRRSTRRRQHRHTAASVHRRDQGSRCQRGARAAWATRRAHDAQPSVRGNDQIEAVLVAPEPADRRQLPAFADHRARGQRRTCRRACPRPSARPSRACSDASTAHEAGSATATVSTPALLEELHQRKQALKQAADNAGRARHDRDRRAAVPEHPDRRAHSGVGARLVRAPADAGAARGRRRARLLCHRRPPGAAPDRPHGRLRDGLRRLGRGVGDVLEKEIKRVVQVVEAYPDTGRRVFQTVLTEFEKFLEHYFKNENEASKQRRLAGPAGRAARDDGDPVHDRAAQDAQRSAGAGRACASSCSRSGPTCWRSTAVRKARRAKPPRP